MRAISAAVSVSAEVSLHNVLRPAPLLRHMDAALWISGLGKHLIGSGGGDAFCVAQNLHVVPNARAAAGLPCMMAPRGAPADGASFGGAADPALRAAAWLDSVGGSSVNIASAMLSSSGKPFAVASRKFVRVGSSGRPAAWSDSQRAALDDAQRADADAAGALLCGMDLPHIERLVPPGEDAFDAPVLVRLTTLPHQFGTGGHFDHAAMLEIVHDAHVLRSGGPEAEDAAHALTASINYMGQAELGDECEVRAVGEMLAMTRVADGALLALARIATS